eukprot:scaffold222555_cov17-Tisochrysis_lutea.AAC.1
MAHCACKNTPRCREYAAQKMSKRGVRLHRGIVQKVEAGKLTLQLTGTHLVKEDCLANQSLFAEMQVGTIAFV